MATYYKEDRFCSLNTGKLQEGRGKKKREREPQGKNQNLEFQ